MGGILAAMEKMIDWLIDLYIYYLYIKGTRVE